MVMVCHGVVHLQLGSDWVLRFKRCHQTLRSGVCSPHGLVSVSVILLGIPLALQVDNPEDIQILKNKVWKTRKNQEKTASWTWHDSWSMMIPWWSMKIKSATCEAEAEAADATDTFEVALAHGKMSRSLGSASRWFLGPRPVPEDVPSTQTATWKQLGFQKHHETWVCLPNEIAI